MSEKMKHSLHYKSISHFDREWEAPLVVYPWPHGSPYASPRMTPMGTGGGCGSGDVDSDGDGDGMGMGWVKAASAGGMGGTSVPQPQSCSITPTH